MTLTCDKSRWQEDGDGLWLCLRTSDRAARAVTLDGPHTLTLEKPKKRRSLDVNAYCWVLINELGNVLRADKDDVYLTMLKRYGQREFISVRANINVAGYFKYYEEAGSGEVGGTPFTHYKVYKGSSEYDTREMSILIDGLISECRAMGIETMTPAELGGLEGYGG